MQNHKFEVHISADPQFDGIKIWFVDRSDGHQQVAQPVNLTFEEYAEGAVIPPTLTLNRWIADEFLQAMAEALDKRGVKVENEHKVHGQLEATKYHLEDMRKIALKLREPNDRV